MGFMVPYYLSVNGISLFVFIVSMLSKARHVFSQNIVSCASLSCARIMNGCHLAPTNAEYS